MIVMWEEDRRRFNQKQKRYFYFYFYFSFINDPIFFITYVDMRI